MIFTILITIVTSIIISLLQTIFVTPVNIVIPDLQFLSDLISPVTYFFNGTLLLTVFSVTITLITIFFAKEIIMFVVRKLPVLNIT